MGARGFYNHRVSAARENSRRIRRMLWIAKLSVLKMREGPVPFLRAVRRGLFDALPPKWKSSLARRRFKTPAAAQNRLALAGHAVDRKDLVTVVLPVFNQADMLAESIDSVLAQTYAPFELIVLDDGSTDDVDAVFAEYSDDPRVRLLRQPNQKLPKALSNAFRFARGEFRTWTSAASIGRTLRASNPVMKPGL